MVRVNTHSRINRKLSGEPIKLENGRAEVLLKTTEEMRADDKGLVHGGFIFSAGDYTAMLAVNHPNVVLAKANVKFIAPVKIGDEVVFKGNIVKEEGRKTIVNVEGLKGSIKVFEGEFVCIITDKHVLDKQ